MGNTVIEVPTRLLHISPLGFHGYATQFLEAADGFQSDDSFSPVPYYLLCRSIELSLKAFLLAKGVPEKKLRKNLGHDLEKVLEKATSMGLANVVSISPQHTEELRKANDYYASKGFEYFEVIRAAKGYQNLPNLTVLSGLTSLLVSKLEPICLQATDDII